jgi:signal peptidase I
MVAPARTQRRASRLQRPLLLVLLTVTVAVFALLIAMLEPLRVTSGSMSPTLTTGDHVLIDKLSGRWRPSEIGDLVVFREPQGGELAVKRIVALEGQTVALEDGVLHVDGAPRHESQVDLASVDSVYFGPVTVPVGGVFVLGDNRGDSIDSRTYGAIPADELVGRVLFVK